MNETGDTPAIAESAHRSVAENAVLVLSDQALDPLFWAPERVGAPSAWWLHVAFAQWIVWAARPSVLVELGTYAGVSYSAFCHAVRQAHLPTRCHAVDTWRGDDHGGHYDESIFQQFKSFHDERFGQFSTLIRTTFDEALDFIEDGCVDILHIDGFHTYESVKHDFDNWHRKLSKSAVVMMHDINERSGDFGVWRLWAELCEQYPSFTFLHGHGLGVLAVGEQAPAAVLELCRLRDPAQIARVRERFARVSAHGLSETRERIVTQQVHELVGENARVQQVAEAETAQIRTALVQAQGELDGARAEVAALRSAAERAERALTEAQREQERLTTVYEELHRAAVQVQAEKDELTGRVEQIHFSLVRAQEELAAKQAAADFKQATTERAVRAAAEDNATLRQLLTQARSELDAVVHLKEQMERSTVWRASTPLRRAASRIPLPIRRAVRGGAKLAWWTARLQLVRKLKERRAIIKECERVAISMKEQAAAAPLLLPSATDPELDRIAALALSDEPRLVTVSGEPETPGHVYHAQEELPKPNPHLRAPSEQTRTDRLLPMLRCPETGSRLDWNEDRSALINLSGSRVWPVTEGRPVLAAHRDLPPIRPTLHIGNEPEEALALIRESSGFVLNLGAGGARETFEHVVQVDDVIFQNTDVVADARVLPFHDETFDTVIVANGFEHYREPHKVAAELRRVLKPGGRILIRAAFLQPLSGEPSHFYHATRNGVEAWFEDFETEALEVSPNFRPSHSVASVVSAAEAALRAEVSPSAAQAFQYAPIGRLVDLWRDPAKRSDPLWTNLEQLSGPSQEAMAAGFQFRGRKPLDFPDLGELRTTEALNSPG